MKKTLSWILVLICMLSIFYLSNMNSNESNNKSKTTITKVIDKTTTITNKDKENQLVEDINPYLRKCAHASIYFILSILLLISLSITINKKTSIIYLINLIICITYAITDEYHQTFISGRTGQITDVLIDTLGSILGIILFYIFCKKYKKNIA